MEPEIDVVRSTELIASGSTPGIVRYPAFDAGGLLISESRIARGVVSAWHHHGGRALFGRIVSGRLNLEFGPGGVRTVQLQEGDFFRIPAGLIHRDVNPSSEVDAAVVAVLFGEGPSTVNVAAPSDE